MRGPSAMQRWWRFNFVGLIGVGVQLATLEFLLAMTRLDYRFATLAAVEAALFHNFAWHLCYTWRERRIGSAGVIARRLVEFHLTNGAVSLAGSWTLISLLVGKDRLPLIAANLITIGACSVVNFLLAEVVVFRKTARVKRPAGRGRKKAKLRLPHPSCVLTPDTGTFLDSKALRAGGIYEDICSQSLARGPGAHGRALRTDE